MIFITQNLKDNTQNAIEDNILFKRKEFSKILQQNKEICVDMLSLKATR